MGLFMLFDRFEEKIEANVSGLIWTDIILFFRMTWMQHNQREYKIQNVSL